MRVHHIGTLGALLAAGIMLVSSAAPVGAQTTVNEQYDGTIVTSGASGTRTVLASVIRMRGVFNGVGHIVELPNLPNDPPTVSRDDLVFAQGTIHFIGFFGDVLSFTFNAQSCTLSLTIQKTSVVEGGTGIFAGATGSFDDIGKLQAMASRNPDGSCNSDQSSALLHEIDTLSGSGSLSLN